MKIDDLIEKLDGSAYAQISRLPRDVRDQAKANGLVIVYGASDDLMEFEGAVYDELGAPCTAWLTTTGLYQNECSEDCPHDVRLREKCAPIKAIWDNKGNPCWRFETKIPHKTFSVFDDGELYCVGLVFRLEDVARALETPVGA